MSLFTSTNRPSMPCAPVNVGERSKQCGLQPNLWRRGCNTHRGRTAYVAQTLCEILFALEIICSKLNMYVILFVVNVRYTKFLRMSAIILCHTCQLASMDMGIVLWSGTVCVVEFVARLRWQKVHHTTITLNVRCDTREKAKPC